VRLALFGAAALLAGCGYVGNPLPPTLDVPQRVTDLVVAEYGDRIHGQFTVLPLTTEGLALRSVREIDLRIGPTIEPWNQDAWAASAKRIPIPAAGAGPVSFDVPASEWIGKEVAIALRVTGPKGKTSDWSTLKTLPIQPPLAAPVGVTAENQPNAINLAWHGDSAHYRIFRAVGDAQPELLAESDQPEYHDAEIEYGTTYRYFVQATAGELQQSDTAASAPIAAEDKFAPSAPSGLTVELGTNSIELAWERNTDPRFQGYNVYRSMEGGPFEKVASLIASPAYSDRQVEPAKKYRYQVSGVGTNTLESARSAIVEIATP
jgi:hypothetical protein